MCTCCTFFFFQAEDGIRDVAVTGVQTCALPILMCFPQTQEGQFGNRYSIAAEHETGSEYEWRCRLHDYPPQPVIQCRTPAAAAVAAIRCHKKEQGGKDNQCQYKPACEEDIKKFLFVHINSADYNFSELSILPFSSNQRSVSTIVSRN